MNKLKTLLLAFVAVLTLTAQAQQAQPLPADPAVRVGKLANGMTYYVRHNALPENRAYFYIAQKVGSVQEEDNQRGLAHFLEHMCFNGSEHFAPGQLVKYCESIGVKFGRELNAYTSTDETVYNIDNVPVTESNIDSCLYILYDWADGLTLPTEEIDKERGVIHEEWRLRSSAASRMFERNLPTLYPGSRYAHRFPIGKMEIIDNFKPQELRAYYEKWYRPDLQGIIVVGDIDVDQIVAKIEKIFSPIKMPENAAPYEYYPVPDNNEPIYVSDKDKEMQQGQIQIFYKHQALPREMRNTIAYLAQDYIASIATGVVSARLEEIGQKADCPYNLAFVGNGSFIMDKSTDCLNVIVIPKPGKSAEAVTAALKEVERAARYGLTATEIARQRETFMSEYEALYNNREKQQSDYYIPKYVRNFLDNEPISAIETNYQLYQALAQVPDAVISEYLSTMAASVDTNFICLAMFPDKEGYAVPTTDELRAAVNAAHTAELEAYVDNVKSEPLVPELPKKGKIKKEEPADFGYTCWTLSNGARVFFKKTDFNESEVSFHAQSFGGSYKTSDADISNVKLFGAVMAYAGLGNFTSTELQKKMAGKQAQVIPSLGSASERLDGSSTPKDLRTLFELIYLRFQEPANDTDAYNRLISLLHTTLDNREKDPDNALSDSVRSTLYGHNPRRANLNKADLANVSYEGIRRIYKERFNAGGDFDFFFTGDFDVDSLRLFAEQYIAPLKAVKKREQPVDLHVDEVKGIVDNHFVRAMETPKANIVRYYTGDVKYDAKTAATVNALGQILTQRYLTSIREESGIAYSVYASGEANFGLSEGYFISVQCPVKPAGRDSALLLMDQAIDDIALNGVTAEELDKVKKFELKTFNDNQRKNEYWEDLIVDKTQWGKDNHTEFVASYNNLTSDDIRDFVNNVLLKQKNRVTVTMLPADFKE